MLRMADGSALSLGFDVEQVGWAFRNAKEAEALLNVARGARSERVSQELVERALAKSFSAFLRLMSCTLVMDSSGRVARAQAASRSPVMKLVNLYKTCMSAVREGKLQRQGTLMACELLNLACLSIIDSVAASCQ
ncbi:MAG: hypothetical protein JTT11_01290 [Candidatus Brockarchaeota archaeon]|nr:hypothetical protein [Candidatus Brockarchaeota archaeon]